MGMTIQPDSETEETARTQVWFQYGGDNGDMRAIAHNGNGNVLSAFIQGGRVRLYTTPGTGMVSTSIIVGPFEGNNTDGYHPSWVSHIITTELDTEQPPGPGPLRYHCQVCSNPIYWDGIFEGKWLHDTITTRST
jgi:hypothetical protein